MPLFPRREEAAIITAFYRFAFHEQRSDAAGTKDEEARPPSIMDVTEVRVGQASGEITIYCDFTPFMWKLPIYLYQETNTKHVETRRTVFPTASI